MAKPDGGPRGPRPAVRVGTFVATMPNGIFGDPLLHVRIPFQKRSLLIDIGEGVKIPARTAHQVTDVLLSHAHVDHIAGFLSFMRSRIGEWPACRVFGPPGIAGNIAGLVAGIHWDRVGRRAPRFDVTEFSDGTLKRFVVKAGEASARHMADEPAIGNVIFEDATLEIRAVVLDHLTPVLAYSLQASATIKVRPDRLHDLGLRPGPWLTELKSSVAAGRAFETNMLPDGTAHDANDLVRELLLVSSGAKLVYATDLADTPLNRAKLEALAADADAFFCEAPFCETEATQALRTGHLTARACGEIAAAAAVARLLPFHFSRRYERNPERVYDEVLNACSATVVPEPVAR